LARHEITNSERAALVKAARAERDARACWDRSLLDLQRLVRQAHKNGASMRTIADVINRSHSRVQQILKKKLS
jgi:hypothetical protein